MKVLRWIGWGVGGFVGLLLAAFVVAAIVYRDIPAEELEAKYANDASKFIDVDGVRMHYRDEGEGRSENPGGNAGHPSHCKELFYPPLAEAHVFDEGVSTESSGNGFDRLGLSKAFVQPKVE